nr:hypothetical protein [Nocardiopsis alkaliphila]
MADGGPGSWQSRKSFSPLRTLVDLRTLVEEGLAWPLPPNRTLQPGRPRQLYRLIVEKLDKDAAGK